MVIEHLHDKRSAHLFFFNRSLSSFYGRIDKLQGYKLMLEIAPLADPAELDFVFLLSGFFMGKSQSTLQIHYILAT